MVDLELKMTNAKNELHHFSCSLKSTPPAIYKAYLLPNLNYAGRWCQSEGASTAKNASAGCGLYLLLTWGMNQFNIRREKRQTCRSFSWAMRILLWGSFSTVCGCPSVNVKTPEAENVRRAGVRAGKAGKGWGQWLLHVHHCFQLPELDGVWKNLRATTMGWDCQPALAELHGAISQVKAASFHYLGDPGAGQTHKSLHSKRNTKGLANLPLKDGSRVSLRARVRISRIMLPYPCMKVSGTFLISPVIVWTWRHCRYGMGKRSIQMERKEISSLSSHPSLVDSLGSGEPVFHVSSRCKFIQRAFHGAIKILDNGPDPGFKLLP